MTIYILSEDPAECAKMLDDKSLERMIRDLAQVLQWCHKYEKFFGLHDKRSSNLKHWHKWARECKANYRYLVKLGIYCCREYHYRNDEKCDPKIVEDGDDHCGAWHKMRDVIDWARDNEPDLPDATQTDNPYIIRCMFNGTPLPLVMPKKHKDVWMQKSFYSEDDDDKKNATIYAYRNFYRAKLVERHYRICQSPSGCKDCYKNHVLNYITGEDELCAWFGRWTKRERPEWLGDL